MTLFHLVTTLIGLVLGIALTVVAVLLKNKRQGAQAKEEAKKLLADANRRAKDIRREADLQSKDEMLKARQDFEREVKDTRRELNKLENRLNDRQEKLDRRMEHVEKQREEIEKRDEGLRNERDQLVEKKAHYETLLERTQAELEKAAGLSKEEASERLIKSVEEVARLEAARRVRLIEEEAKEEADTKANWIIGTAVQRMANHNVQERTVSVVPLPSDELKGRIIGREGRNIRTLEQITGIDLIVDDTPEAVVISGFNPIRREVARLTLEELIEDGRIHPARIEEVAHKVEKQIENKIKELGKQALFDLGLSHMHPELSKLVGKLNYRTSYGQNQYKHALEAAYIAGMIAAEMGENVKIAKRAALLHDVGKVIDHDAEGGHAVVGAEFARKHGEEKIVWHAIGAHHEDYPIETLMDVIVQAADAISGARPGARRETLETYTKRLTDLEDISKSFKQVEKAYAIQAGREIRVVVENHTTTDEDAVLLSQDIAKKIEEELNYPGQVKITVIRETRAVEYAR